MTHACERTHKKDLCWMIVQYLLSCALTSLRVLRPRPCRTLELPRALARTADCSGIPQQHALRPSPVLDEHEQICLNWLWRVESTVER